LKEKGVLRGNESEKLEREEGRKIRKMFSFEGCCWKMGSIHSPIFFKGSSEKRTPWITPASEKKAAAHSCTTHSKIGWAR
jgi:hypothetical protein